MNKLALISISLLVLIIGFGCVAAADMNGTIDDSTHAVDNQCGIDEISTHADDVNDNIDHSVADYADNSQSDVNDNIGHSVADHVNEITDSSPEPINNDAGVCDSVKEFSRDNITGPADNIGNLTIQNSTQGSAQNQTIIIDNSTQNTSGQTPSVVNIIDDTPKEIKTTGDKYKNLKPDIEKYSKYLQKHQYTKNANGKTFSEMDLLLEIHKHYSFEDTVIIAMHVLRDNGYKKVTLLGLEGMLKQMMDGTLNTYADEMNASYYKNEMQKIHKSHEYLNKEAKKYSDIFLNKEGKKFTKFPEYSYWYRDLLVEIYLDHSSIEETVLIATYALQNAGLNVTAASLEHTFDLMMKGTLHTENGHIGGDAYFFILSLLKNSHQTGKNKDKMHETYYTVYGV
ncbi:hypothetical protein [Methanobrevibacter sp.]|uniref:hypothetical protein n=1 Tax=Methanobrevibacter sp. TaxID=66852 RepID=UPI00388EA296